MPPKRKGAVSTATHWEDLAWHPHVCLEYTTDAQTRTVDLLGGAAYIGRNSHLRLAFCEPVVSQTHALVEFDGKKRQWKIRDMGSSHGTAVNGKAVSAKRATFLKDGDQIMLSEEIEMSVKVRFIKSYLGVHRRTALLSSSVEITTAGDSAYASQQCVCAFNSINVN